MMKKEWSMKDEIKTKYHCQVTPTQETMQYATNFLQKDRTLNKVVPLIFLQLSSSTSTK